MRLPVILAACVLVSGCDVLGLAEDPTYDPYQRVGASAHALLAGDALRSLTIEVQAVRGREPSAEALQNLREFLEERLNKPGGIQVVVDPSLPPNDPSHAYEVEEIRELDRRNRRRFSSGTEAAAYVLFLDGRSSRDTSTYNTLGQAYWNTSMVIFEDTLRKVGSQVSLSSESYAIVESVTLLHEFGHILGLVANGTPPQSAHEDDAHPAHCANPSCLMHHSVENGSLARSVLSGELPALDDGCLRDLRANGGK